MKLETVQRRLIETHGDAVKIIDSTYVGFKKKARFIDIEFGEWDAYVYAVCRGGRHKQRFIAERRITIDEAQQRLEQKHEGRIVVKCDTWKNAGTRCIFIDLEFGEWESLFYNVLCGNGHPERVKQRRSESQRLTIEEIQATLDRLHDGKVTFVGPYVNAGVKCKFNDVEFGEFEASPTNVLYKGTGHLKRALLRRKETSLETFGVSHPMQCDEIFLKCLRSNRKHFKSIHWRTCQQLNCLNNWELAFVEWCNTNKEDFLWQPKAFKMPNGRTYRPDAYLPARDLWIDIKGYYPEASRVKCEWFKSIMPNFELWFKADLERLGILKTP